MLRLWLYLAGVEASNYKSVEEVHAALVIPGMHEVIVVMSVVFYLLPYVDQVCTQLSAQLLIQCMSNLVEYGSSQISVSVCPGALITVLFVCLILSLRPINNLSVI